MIRRNIPNALTCANLLCGCIGVVEAFHNNLVISCILIGAALIFDFFDGFLARLLKVSSAIGKDLDSLADMVTFGLLPAIIVYQLLMQSIPDLLGIWKAYPAFIIAIFSALRLAKFNNDPRQSDSFIGLPTPANAMLIASLPVILLTKDPFWKDIIVNTTNLLILSVVMSFMLVMEMPLIALKFKHFGWKGNEFRFLLIASTVILILTLKILAVPAIIILYILLSVVDNVTKKDRSIGNI
ncbi:CDP-diacylglycerol--serine O-phosphatidyltransferase [Dyadobacter chenhuakuii]|uniref:CDP-diacylglycerol--serine O-phosphatidyltransferase n=1 Tax=Dyadobacter chenhuakuii TaxID=2909339 RepID=A0ABY4XSR3_9BACT|nr:CDP-diacylglycerol--serine O-phosphatidyltransferase [Dyadobacter chenhuakuii]MCF2492258.1 CDP-diacylglycerol--serine O-phosphatidyltransferase [Dyadobacter chenhuakuii]USJ33435.1 CDP-diacylglycerol--serine O-phosphatidyltransferase [Dyadobacter chenhuakuii]